MQSVNQRSNETAKEFIRDRLPEGFLLRLPSTIREGYQRAVKHDAPLHLQHRWAACDRFWWIQAEWKRLGEDFPDVQVIKAWAPKGGGPFYALEYNGLLMTVHKVGSAQAAPRPAAYRSDFSREHIGNQTIEQLSMVSILQEAGQLLDAETQAIINNLRSELKTRCGLYMLITHSPDEEGENPAFIQAMIVNPKNEILASVDLGNEIQSIMQRRMTAELEVVEIHEPSPIKRRDRKKASEG